VKSPKSTKVSALPKNDISPFSKEGSIEQMLPDANGKLFGTTSDVVKNVSKMQIAGFKKSNSLNEKAKSKDTTPILKKVVSDSIQQHKKLSVSSSVQNMKKFIIRSKSKDLTKLPKRASNEGLKKNIFNQTNNQYLMKESVNTKLALSKSIASLVNFNGVKDFFQFRLNRKPSIKLPSQQPILNQTSEMSGINNYKNRGSLNKGKNYVNKSQFAYNNRGSCKNSLRKIDIKFSSSNNLGYLVEEKGNLKSCIEI